VRNRIDRFAHDFTGLQPKAFVINHEQQSVALDRWAGARQNTRHDRNALEMDVLPDVEFGPVGERENANAFALVLPRIVDIP